MSTLKTFLCATAATLTLLSVAGQQAKAGQIYQGWNYGIDSADDGSGGSSFNIDGIATTQIGDQVYVALTGGMPLTGVPYGGINIGWGDLFLNFSGQDFQTASNNNDLFAIRFANSTSSNNNTSFATGVYSGVSAKSITLSNYGYSSLLQYYTEDNGAFNVPNTQGTDLPTAQSVYNYYEPSAIANNPSTAGNTSILNVINSGTNVGGISQLTAAQLSAAGLDFGHFNALGTQTFGFSFNASLIPSGNYMANIFLGCGNDAVALKGNIQSTPEPTTTAGLFVVGLVFGITQVRKSRKISLS